jgi:cation transport regulator ChaB
LKPNVAMHDLSVMSTNESTKRLLFSMRIERRELVTSISKRNEKRANGENEREKTANRVALNAVLCNYKPYRRGKSSQGLVSFSQDETIRSWSFLFFFLFFFFSSCFSSIYKTNRTAGVHKKIYLTKNESLPVHPRD